MLVHIDEPMRVAPGGHVIDLKAGETVTGGLAEYLVSSRCNVTVLEPDEPPADGPEDDGGLTASLTATADVLPRSQPEPVPDKPATAKPGKTTKATAK